MTRGRMLQMSGVIVDLVHRVDRLPNPGEDVESRETSITAGGGFNAMFAARQFGIDVDYGGAIGSGFFAGVVERALLDAGIRILLPRTPGHDQGTCVVLVDGRAERTFVSHHGAERMLTEQGLRALNPGERDWILLSGYGLFKNTSARLLAPWVGELGKGPVFVFDPGPVVADIPPEILDRVLSRADWVTANQKESEILTGRFDPGGAAEVLARGRRGAIVRVGKDGCWLATGGGADFVAGFPVDTVDTNGAGDTHAGAFIAACGLGHDVQGATVLANAAAALSTTRHGPATAPSLGETIAFLASRDIRLQVSKNVAQMDVA